NEMTNLLTVTDVEVVREWDGLPAGSSYVVFDPRLEWYAVLGNGRLTLRQVGEGRVVFECRIPYTEHLLFSPDGRKLAYRLEGKVPRIVCRSLDAAPGSPLWGSPARSCRSRRTAGLPSSVGCPLIRRFRLFHC